MEISYTWFLKRALAVMLPLFLLNWVGVDYSLYSIIWWWDVMTHFLGGIFIGFLLLAIRTRWKLFRGRSTIRYLTITALSIFVGWELYEILINIIIPVYRFDIVDTLHDVVNDCLGCAVAYNWYRLFTNTSHNQ